MNKIRTKQIIYKNYSITTAVSYEKVKNSNVTVGNYQIVCVVLSFNGTTFYNLKDKVCDKWLTPEKLVEAVNNLYIQAKTKIDKPKYGVMEQILIDNGFK